MNQQDRRPLALGAALGTLAGAAGTLLALRASSPPTSPPPGPAGTVIRIAAGQSLPRVLVSGTVGKPTQYLLLSGSHPPQVRFQSSDLHDVVIEGEAGAKIQGGTQQEALGFSHFHRLTIRDLELTGGRNCFFANQGSGLTIQRVRCHHPAPQQAKEGIGILLGSVDQILVEDYTGEDTQDHGFYASEPCKRVTLRRLTLRRNGKAALQINANEGPGPRPWWTGPVTAEDVLVEQCQGAGLNLAGVHDGILRHVRVHGTQHLGAALFNDGSNAVWCEHVLFEDSEFLNTRLAAIQIHPSSKDIRLKGVRVAGGSADIEGKPALMEQVSRPDGKPVRRVDFGR